MDYTPISARRVLLGFAFTGFIALLPALYVLLQSDRTPPFVTDASGFYRAAGLMIGSVLLTAGLIALFVLLVSLARRAARPPTNA